MEYNYNDVSVFCRKPAITKTLQKRSWIHKKWCWVWFKFWRSVCYATNWWRSSVLWISAGKTRIELEFRVLNFTNMWSSCVHSFCWGIAMLKNFWQEYLTSFGDISKCISVYALNKHIISRMGEKFVTDSFIASTLSPSTNTSTATSNYHVLFCSFSVLKLRTCFLRLSVLCHSD